MRIVFKLLPKAMAVYAFVHNFVKKCLHLCLDLEGTKMIKWGTLSAKIIF